MEEYHNSPTQITLEAIHQHSTNEMNEPGRKQKRMLTYCLVFAALVIAMMLGLIYIQFYQSQQLNQKLCGQRVDSIFPNFGSKISRPNVFDHQYSKEHADPKLEWNYPTLGSPETNSEFNFTEVTYQQMIDWQKQMADLLFKPYIVQIEQFQNTNCEISRIGNDNDGGYLICSNFLSKSEALINIGIEGKDEFGCSLTTKYPMPNYQFDCTSKVRPQCRTNGDNNVYMEVCVLDRSEWTESVNFASLKDIIDSNNIKGKHITLKMDVEGAEWVALRSLPLTYLQYVDQIVIEIHLPGVSINHKAYWGNLQTIRSLSKSFVAVNLHMNNMVCNQYWGYTNRYFKAFAFEVTLVNRGLISLKTQIRSFAQHPLNRLNVPQRPITCRMSD